MQVDEEYTCHKWVLNHWNATLKFWLLLTIILWGRGAHWKYVSYCQKKIIKFMLNEKKLPHLRSSNEAMYVDQKIQRKMLPLGWSLNQKTYTSLQPIIFYNMLEISSFEVKHSLYKVNFLLGPFKLAYLAKNIPTEKIILFSGNTDKFLNWGYHIQEENTTLGWIHILPAVYDFFQFHPKTTQAKNVAKQKKTFSVKTFPQEKKCPHYKNGVISETQNWKQDPALVSPKDLQNT